jgi:uncharacterized membrane protein required for colicin V production
MPSLSLVSSIVVALIVFSALRGIVRGIYKTLNTPGED